MSPNFQISSKYMLKGAKLMGLRQLEGWESSALATALQPRVTKPSSNNGYKQLNDYAGPH
jgi:hypothetical protein